MSLLATTASSDSTGGRNFTCLPFSLTGPLFPEAMRVYARAFAGRPYNMEPAANERSLTARLGRVHAYKPGLLAIAAVSGERVAGMTYGYHLEQGDWWGDLVRDRLSPESQQEWLSDAFVAVELAVDPEFQGQGLGATLMESLLEGRPEQTALLSTRTDARAHHLYRRLGFEVLTEMSFGHGPWHFIMGRRLS